MADRAERRRGKLLLVSTILLIGYLTQYSSILVLRVSADEDLAQRALAIIRDKCLQCHGEDRLSGLDLRTREAALRGGVRGRVISGSAAQSLLYRMITGSGSPRMPQGGSLAPAEIETLRMWLDAGAPWPANGTPVVSAGSIGPRDLGRSRITEENRRYWAFRKPVRHAPPAVARRSWAINPIDAFILAGLEAKRVSPSPRADRRTLIRRVTYDLTGLPPTPAEVDAFLADNSPGAWEKVVRRLLASPRYGERWAQNWLDVVRFAETNGFEHDADREQAWRYRDYVVKAFNQDKPYDRFLLEQIAGDEIDPDDFEMRVATGFLRTGPQHVTGGNQDLAVNRQEWLTEVMFGIGNGIMGMTVGCARCHDHKFDPILQADFYRMQAFFAAADNIDFQRPTKEQAESFKSAQAAHDAKLKPIKDEIAAIEKPYQERLKAEKQKRLEPLYADALAKPADKRTDDEKRLASNAQRMITVGWDEIVNALSPDDRSRRARLRQQMHRINLFAPEPLPKALAVSDSIRPDPPMRMLKAGDPHRPADEVRPGFLTALLPAEGPWDAQSSPIEKGEFRSSGRKLALAKWLIQPDHPLTARVMVNRLWHYHFGRGIVSTPNDFGKNGQLPTHPELLDWLATEFVARGWSVKEMHLMMLLSNTYQQASDNDPRNSSIDPDNTLFWRMNRQRIDAESIRDTTLFVAGNLTEKIGGPSIRVPLEPEVYDTIFTEYEPDNLWPAHPDPAEHTRRSLYLIRKRNVRLPLFVAFDSPDMMSSCGARTTSVHALQSLTLLNSGFIFDQSRMLASRVLREGGGNQARSIDLLYKLTLGRHVTTAESRLIRQFLIEHRAIIAERERKGEPISCFNKPLPGISAVDAAVWVDLCLATMNLNEFLYLR